MVLMNSDSRDAESGEIARQKVIVLRKKPKIPTPPALSANYRKFIPSSRSLMRDRQLYRGFRIQDSLNRIRLGQVNESQLPYGLSYREFIDLARREHFIRKPPFRVPPENLPVVPNDDSKGNRNTVCITIWREFLYGTDVLGGLTTVTTESDETVYTVIYRYLKKFISPVVLNMLIYTVFFLVYFYSIFVYNMVLQLIGLILLARHLQIHEKAYENNLDVSFTGSIFQGPMYACVRTWCHHCIHREQAKIVLNHMKQMKKDIQERQKEFSYKSL